MKKIAILLLVVGVVALLALNWNYEAKPEFRELTQVSTKDVVQVIISVLLLAASIFVILSKKYAEKEQHWAYGTIGTLIGFWLKT
jgi:anaerobic C4-dicarboxylate transporter